MRTTTTTPLLWTSGSTFFLGLALAPQVAEACGCFAFPTPAEPVVQAGERIVFAHEDDKVIAHIQIQYDGDAEDFAWMLPMPAVPELRLGSEELFAALDETTRPQFVLIPQRGEDCGGGLGCGDEASLSGAVNAPAEGAGNVAVVQSSAGPYEYAVVRADEKKPMFDWLTENGYVVPSDSDASFDPYIHEGAFFLALKLRSGANTGDLQPIVVEYASDRPMIPIVLTSMGAVNGMGILVWVLGDVRAVPLNYKHVGVNLQHIDWVNQANNYQEVVSRAIDETEDGHAFVTEFAGSSEQARTRLGDAGRFGDAAELTDEPDAHGFVTELRARGFSPQSLRAILQRALDIPASELDAIQPPPPFTGQTVEEQYWNVYITYAQLRSGQPFDAAALAEEIWTKVVEPAREAISLVGSNPYLTRLFTTMDPDEMTEDPVFAFNSDLPDVPQLRRATQINHCNDDSVELVLDDGRAYYFDEGETIGFAEREGIPYATHIEILGLEGPPEIVTDNRALLADTDDASEGGCTDAGSRARRRRGLATAFLFGIILVGRSLLRRRVRR